MSSRLGLVAEVIATESPSQLRPVVIQRMCAVTASVFFFAAYGLSAAVAMAAPLALALLSRLTDPRQRIPDQLVHHPMTAEARLHQHHPRRLTPHLADLRRPLAPVDPLSALSARSAASAATHATNVPSLATYIGSIPRSSAAPATAAFIGTAASRTRI